MKVPHTHLIGVLILRSFTSSVMTAFWHLSVKPSSKVFNTSMNLFLKMAQYIEVTFAKVSDMALALKYGLMAPNMKESGVTTKLMERVSSGTQTEMSMKENGKTIKPTGTVSTFMSMEPDTKATGRTICKMVPVSKAGLMALVMTVAIRRE